jgi:Ca2+-dependent lipid-binding protein
MKVYDTKEKEMILEPSFKFAGNPNIIVAVKAFGLKATVQLVDVQVFATARITLKPLVPVFPCFSKIVVSLMEKPHVDFGLKLLGGDVMAIPGLYGFVQDTIRDQVAAMYMWPKTLEIPVIDDPSAAKRPVGIVEVKIIRAKNLVKKDFMGKSDPYVKIQLVNTVFSKTTRTKMSTLNPEWNEAFKLLVQDPKSQSLELQVFDWEKIGAHEKLGMQIVPLKDLVEDQPKMYTVPLVKNMDPNDEANTRKNRGEITFEMTFKPFKEDDNKDEIAAEAVDGTQRAPEGTNPNGACCRSPFTRPRKLKANTTPTHL